MTDKLSEQLNASKEYQSTFDEMVKALVSNADKFSKVTKDQVSSIESNRLTIEDGLGKFNSSITSLRELFIKHKDDLQNIIDSVSKIKMQHQKKY